MKRRVARILATTVLLGIAGLLVVGGSVAYYALSLPLSQAVAVQVRQPSLSLKAADGSALGHGGPYRGEPVQVDDLPRYAVDAVLAVEDRRFYDHHGLDFAGIARALMANVRAGGIAEGGSTITQQLARTMFLSPERTLRRKVQEAMIALWLERRLKKDEILARYLNTIYFGGGAWGIDGASRRYFGKSARQLTLPEAAMLAGLIQAPSTYAPTRDLRAAQQRAAVVLTAMVDAGSLDARAAAAAKEAPATLTREAAIDPGRRYFADWAANQAATMLGPNTTAAVVETTLDPDLQRLAEDTIRNIVGDGGGESHAGQVAMVVMRNDGAVLAMVGGTDYEASQFNRATQARRQAGSLFKLFVYAAASQRGYTAHDMFTDQPVRVGNWTPSNIEDYYRGPVSLRTAFAQSINSVAVQLASEVGWARVAEVAQSMGITSPLMPVPALSLGAADVTLVEMTSAFAAVAADKARVWPHGIQRILVGDAVVEVATADQPPPAWDREMMLDLLTAVMREGTAAGAALDRPSAGKTGTSQDYRDAWFVGFTSDVVVGVWVGNDDNSPMDHVTGSRLPARIWHAFMIGADRLKVASAPAVPPQYAAAPEVGVPYVSVTTPSDTVGVETAPAQLAGVPVVLDPGTLALGGHVIRLFGVSGDARFTAQMQRFIAGREIRCQAMGGGGDRHRCEIGGQDLARIVLYNGGGRSSAEAPPPLIAAEQNARSAQRGTWGG